ncbi:MAG: MBOAT family protein [Ruminococcus sp.]|nr:MBOAT family protein [Ruminococcus sp.]
MIASYAFYLFAGYKYAFFILFTTVSTYLLARIIDSFANKSDKLLKEHKKEWSREQKKKFKDKVKIKKRLIMASGLVANFGILAFLKYYNFFAESFNSLFNGIGLSSHIPILDLFLPLGISFYTFQSMGYIVDVYRGKVEAEKNIAKFALFVSFFPQIIQGPIGIYDELAFQLYEPHNFDFNRLKHGAELILWGYFKKLVIADRAVVIINTVCADYTQYNGTTIFAAVLVYSLQLYADFSAGIDISRGIAQIIGINMAENFRRPYFSKSINEYWRRWHITLGGWMKNYVFYPLAMSELFINTSKKMKNSRFGKTTAGAYIAKVFPTSVASLIVFFLVGVWHGANWKYVAFGLWNGLIIMISILLKPVFDYINKKLHINPKSFGFGVFQMLRTFIIVLVGYVFDIAPNFTGGMDMIFRVITDSTLGGIRTTWRDILACGIEPIEVVILVASTVLLFVVSIIQEKNSSRHMRDLIDEWHPIFRIALIYLCLAAILFFGAYGPGYNAGEFVYMQF